MKKDDKQKLHQSTLAQLEKKAEELVREIATTKLELKAGKLSDTSKVKRLKKDLVRVKTIMQEKKFIKSMEEKEENQKKSSKKSTTQ